MHELLEFAARHWVIVALGVAAFIWVLIEEARRQQGGSSSLSPQEVVQKMNHEKAIVLDVRDSAAFEKGHIVGAVNIARSQIDRDISQLDKYRDKPLILVCVVGRSVVSLLAELRKRGFGSVYLLEGGMNGWVSANMPVVKGKQ